MSGLLDHLNRLFDPDLPIMSPIVSNVHKLQIWDLNGKVILDVDIETVDDNEPEQV